MGSLNGIKSKFKFFFIYQVLRPRGSQEKVLSMLDFIFCVATWMQWKIVWKCLYKGQSENQIFIISVPNYLHCWIAENDSHAITHAALSVSVVNASRRGNARNLILVSFHELDYLIVEGSSCVDTRIKVYALENFQCFRVNETRFRNVLDQPFVVAAPSVVVSLAQ